MIPLLALASLLAGATYFGLPDWDQEEGENTASGGPEGETDAAQGSLLDEAAEPPLLQGGGDSGAGVSDVGNPAPQGLAVADPTVTELAEPDVEAGGEDTPTEALKGAASDQPVTPVGQEYGTFRSLTGTDGDETLRAGFGDTLSAGAGDDALIGFRGDDHLIGGAGDDLLRAGGGNNFLDGGAGSDLLLGVETHADIATGLETMLSPPGGPSIDVLDGGAGDDVLRMGHGDVGIGGDGSDIFEVQADAPEDEAHLPVIEDFDPEHDRLVLAVPFSVDQIAAAWPNTPEHEATVTVEDFEDGSGATIYVDGEAVANVTGAQGLDPGLIRLTGSDLIGPDYAQLEAAKDPALLWHGVPAQPVTGSANV